MKVSVVMSVYNGEPFLTECIDSILQQTYRDFELIVVNDASTDNTAQILNDYAKRDNRIKIIRNDSNIGLTKSLIKAIDSSSGDYIARIDADDVMLPNRLEHQKSELDNNTELVLVGSDYENIDLSGRSINKVISSRKQNIKKSLLMKNILAHSTVMFRRGVYYKAGMYNKEMYYAQDYDLWLRMSDLGNFKIVPIILTQRRITPDMITIGKRKKQLLFEIKGKINYLSKHPHRFYIIFPSIMRICIPDSIRRRWQYQKYRKEAVAQK